MPPFDYYEIHPNFERHQIDAGRRVVERHEVDDVWYGSRRFVRSRRRYRSYLMIGLTSAGRQITVVVRPTKEADTWQIYTAWDTKVSD